MISIAPIPGAPKPFRHGEVARRTSMQVLPPTMLPVTREAMCITWEYRTTLIMSWALTVPISQAGGRCGRDRRA